MADTLQRVERDMSGLSSWKTEIKRPAARDKAKAIALFGNIQTRLSENRLKAWNPPQNLAPLVSFYELWKCSLEPDRDLSFHQDLDNDWRSLLKAETTYMRRLDEHYRQYVKLAVTPSVSQTNSWYSD